MTNENQLPESDLDLQLARTMDQVLQQKKDLEEINDPMISGLMAYRQYSQNDELPVPSDGREVWDRIAGETTPVSERIYNLAINTRVWAAAACLLIAVSLSIYYQYQINQPALLSSSGSQIQVVQLSDGSEVTLRPHSSLYEIRASETEQRYRLSGEGYFSVANVPGRLFTVESKQGRAEVLGTRFVMRDWGQVTQIFLEEGAVRFETADRSEFVILKPGESSSISLQDGLLSSSMAGIEEFLDWTRHELLFDSRPVHFVLKELEHHFQITIEAPENIKKDVLGGAISLNDQKQSLNDLGAVLNGRFVTDDDIHFTFIPN